MSDIEKVKKLREISGAGFKDCNLAIKESDGDIDKAIEILRVKGISKASKKMSRDAKEGVIAVSGDESKTSVIEVNCETDFVAKNEDFTNFVTELSELNNQIKKRVDFETFINKAPQLNPYRSLITGVVCGVRVEDIEEPTMQEIRYLDKMIDELSRGKLMEKILRH